MHTCVSFSFVRCSVDLSQLEHEETHDMWVDLEDGAGKIHLVLTITGRSSPELLNISDLTNYRHDDERAIMANYSWKSTLQMAKINDIGREAKINRKSSNKSNIFEKLRRVARNIWKASKQLRKYRNI